jgi:SAM-dependent methyltransferase
VREKIEKSIWNVGAAGTAIGLAIAIAAAWLGTHSRKGSAPHYPILPFATVRPVLEGRANELPAELHEPNESKWNAWAQREDAAIRARLEQGARDSMINLLLFGTSFTDQPRARGILEPDDPLLQSRLNDFLRGVRDPRGNERLAFVRNVLGRRGLNIDSPNGHEQTKAFVLENLQRVTREQRVFRQRFDDPTRESDRKIGLSERSGVFRDRGIALDTKILSSFGIGAALRDMKAQGAVREGSIIRIAVIGPGLDFADKGFGSDFYPLQTLQPFAICDSLVRLGLAQAGKIDIVAFDISPEVLGHLRRVRERARAGEEYVVQLPRESRPWVPDAIEYWRSFGSAIAEPVAPIQPPPALKDLETRAVRIRPQVVMSCQPVDLNIVLEQLGSPSKERFDLVIATNVFVYYDSLEQALALQNISTFLKPGGFLLTNDWLPPPLSEIPMRVVQYTPVRYGEGPFERDNIFWWQRQ